MIDIEFMQVFFYKNINDKSSISITKWHRLCVNLYLLKKNDIYKVNIYINEDEDKCRYNLYSWGICWLCYTYTIEKSILNKIGEE